MHMKQLQVGMKKGPLPDGHFFFLGQDGSDGGHFGADADADAGHLAANIFLYFPLIRARIECPSQTRPR